MVYHLNKKSKFLTVGIGFVACLIGVVVFVSMLISGQIAQNIGALLFLEFLFGFLGIELVYEGLRTRIEVFDDRLVYYQPRYAFSAQWSDLSEIVPSANSVLLFFSKSTKISGGLIYDVIKTTNLHSSLAISMYLTDENRTLIREKIAAGLKDNPEGDTQWLSELI